MDYGLKGKIAVVCGASMGLGRASADALAREGASLLICSRNQSGIDGAAADIQAKTGARVVAVAADVSTAAGCDKVVKAAYDAYGRIDVLIVNAGGPPAGFFMNFTDDDWQKSFELTLMSAVRLVRAVLPGMREQKWGRIVYVASGSVKNPLPNLLMSNVFRTGVVQMLKTISREVAAEGVTINSLCPGRMDTERVRSLDEFAARRKGITPEESKAEEVAMIPTGRYGTAEEYAEVMAFLCSEAASYVTGVTWQVDGGQNRFLF